MWAMGFIPGAGLFGVDAQSGFFYQIDRATGLATVIGPTGIMLLPGAPSSLGITDIAYDSEAHRLIALAGGPEEPLFSTVGAQGRIYSIDSSTGSPADNGA